MMRALRLIALLAACALFPRSHGPDFAIVECRRSPRFAPPTAQAEDDRLHRPAAVRLLDPARAASSASRTGRGRSPCSSSFSASIPAMPSPTSTSSSTAYEARYREKLHMYVAEARFVLARPPASIDLPRLRRCLRRALDPAIKHRPIHGRRAEPAEGAEGRPQPAPAAAAGARAGTTAICIQSTYKLEGRLPIGIALANKLREGHAADLRYARVRQRADGADAGGSRRARARQADRPRYAGRRRARAEHLLRQPGDAVRQAPRGVPGAPERPERRPSSASSWRWRSSPTSWCKQKRIRATCRCCGIWCRRRCLSGKSSFNTGKSLSAGLPVYARNQIRAIAAILETDGRCGPLASRTGALAASAATQSQACDTQNPSIFRPFLP